jgi:cytochrome c biogenesis protein CcdA
MSIGSLGLAFVAGLLSILSPCVLPLLPIVFGTAASEHRAGPVALAGGVVLSFVGIGLFVGAIGYAIGLDSDVFRNAGALLMALVGLVLLAPPLQLRLVTAGGPISDWADRRFSIVRGRGLGGQFGIGLLLGAVWSPCAGPTLGAAIALAAQGASLGQVGATMLAFGFGAAIPQVGLGLISRHSMARWRERLLDGGKSAKAVLGAILVLLGLSIVSGFDKRIETVIVGASPEWLTSLTTRF